MKTIDKIPKEIIEMYSIEEYSNAVIIHKPNAISFQNNEVEVVESDTTVEFHCKGEFIISLWKEYVKTHVTIL